MRPLETEKPFVKRPLKQPQPPPTAPTAPQPPPQPQPQPDTASRPRVTWQDDEDITTRSLEDKGFSGCTCGVAAALLRSGAVSGVRSGLRRAARALVHVVKLPLPSSRRHRCGSGSGSGAVQSSAAANPAAGAGSSAPRFSLAEEQDLDLEEFSPIAGAARAAAIAKQRYGGGWPTGMVALCELDLTDLPTTASWTNHRLDDANFCAGGGGGRGGGGGGGGGGWFHPGPSGHHIDLTAPTPAPTPRDGVDGVALSIVAGGEPCHGAAAAAAAAAGGPGGGKDLGACVGNVGSSCGPVVAAATFRLWSTDSYNSSSYSEMSPVGSVACPCAAVPVSPTVAGGAFKESAAAAMAVAVAAPVMATAATLCRTGSLPPLPPQPLFRQPPLLTVGSFKGRALEEGTPLLSYDVSAAAPGFKRSCGGR
ncbi:hypothetical protein PLESTF_000521400 [Pleodorina starrii]|nr:hypothetical protein PLESTM_000184800 [Pleodorina starrii]GLC67138.1 hypothetical protein PLESTF_000521400 [Pleodorina starrii]